MEQMPASVFFRWLLFWVSAFMVAVVLFMGTAGFVPFVGLMVVLLLGREPDIRLTDSDLDALLGR